MSSVLHVHHASVHHLHHSETDFMRYHPTHTPEFHSTQPFTADGAIEPITRTYSGSEAMTTPNSSLGSSGFSTGRLVGRPDTALPELVNSLVDAAHVGQASRSYSGSCYSNSLPGSMSEYSYLSRRASNSGPRSKKSSGLTASVQGVPFAPPFPASRRASYDCTNRGRLTSAGGRSDMRATSDSWAGSLPDSTVMSWYLEKGGVVCAYEAYNPVPKSQRAPGFSPLNLLFRWYSRAGSSFYGSCPKAEDLPDAPLQPPPELFSRNTDWGVPDHHVNRNADPLINQDEILILLLDYDIVPLLASRGDVMTAFKLAAHTPICTPNKIPRSSVKPDELNYTQFSDFLVRLALVMGAAAAATPSAMAANPCYPVPTEMASTLAAVRSLMVALQIHEDVHVLRKQLLLHLAAEPDRVSKRKRLNYMYVASKLLLHLAAEPDRVAKRKRLNYMYVASKLAAEPDRVAKRKRLHYMYVASKAQFGSPIRNATWREYYEGYINFGTPIRIATWWEYDEGYINLGDTNQGEECISRITIRNSSPDNAQFGTPIQNATWRENDEGYINLGDTNQTEECVPRITLTLTITITVTPTPTPQFGMPIQIATWREEYDEGYINLGDTNQGEECISRITIRNSSPDNVHLRVDTSNAPFLKCVYSERPLAPGLSRTVDVFTCFQHTGEWTGQIKVFSRTLSEPQSLNVIPFFANVVVPLDSYKGISIPRSMPEPVAGLTSGAVGPLLR
eukprot:gene22908-30085_t